ncbi:MAG TPA: hypothetical protein VIF43_02025 [Patescibacteria group bacterium]|jgi:hypothetical protein
MPEESIGEGDIDFVKPEDDTPENRAIIRTVEERQAASGEDRTLEEIAAELGMELPAFVRSSE